MSGRVGTIARIGAFAALALLLSGCIKLTMDLQVGSDDTVSGTIQLGIQKELLELSGGSVSDILGTDSPFPSDAPGVTVEEFDDGEFAGQEFTFDSVPIGEFQTPDDPDSLNIERVGETFVVSGVLDMSAASGATGLGATGAEVFDSAVIRITISFPGDVQEASGTIDGNSVTWEPKFGERLEISATASAVDDGDAGDAADGGGGGSSMTIILIIVAVVVVGAIIAFFVMKSRKGGGAGGEQAAAPAVAPGAPAMGGEVPPVTPPAAPPAPPAPPTPPAG